MRCTPNLAAEGVQVKTISKAVNESVGLNRRVRNNTHETHAYRVTSKLNFQSTESIPKSIKLVFVSQQIDAIISSTSSQHQHSENYHTISIKK